MNMKRIAVASAMLALPYTPTVFAAEINWSGFMSIAAGKTLDYDTTYVADAVTNGTYNDKLLFSPESMVGLQAQSKISDKMRATVQIVAHGVNNFSPSVEWAFVSYDLSENFTINAGRIRLPLYFYSDYLDVGYAYHWIRPPMDVYAIPQSGLEGVSVRYNGYIADTVEFNLEGWYGASDLDIASSQGFENIGKFEVRDDMGLNAVFSWEWIKFRLMYNKLKTSSATRFIETGEVFSNIDTPVNYKSAALMIDYENVIWRSEVTKLDNGFNTDAGYTSIGYQIGDFLPHATYSFKEEELNFTTFFPQDTSSYTIGINWNFSPAAVLKLEYIDRTIESQEVVGFDPATFTFTTKPLEIKNPMFAIAIDLIF